MSHLRPGAVEVPGATVGLAQQIIAALLCSSKKLTEMSRTAQAWAAKEAKAPLETIPLELSPLGLHDVEVKVTHCGICHSDLHLIDGACGARRAHAQQSLQA